MNRTHVRLHARCALALSRSVLCFAPQLLHLQSSRALHTALPKTESRTSSFSGETCLTRVSVYATIPDANRLMRMLLGTVRVLIYYI